MDGAARRERLACARLYLVLEARPHGEDPASLLDAALRGGVDVVQLRDKDLPDDALVGAAAVFRRACDAHGALFVLNDRPDLVEAAAADGVHVGQSDAPAALARAAVGPERLVGLSVSSRAELAAAAGADVDYLGVGAVFGTPTKPDAESGGLALVQLRPSARVCPGSRSAASTSTTRPRSPQQARPGSPSYARSGTPRIRRPPPARYAPRWVNHPPPEPSWKTTVFSPLSSTTSK